MFNFDGNAGGGSRVNLGGKGRNRTRGTEESKSDFVKRQHKEREARERKRLQEQASVVIQKVYRSYRCLSAARNEQRKVFDKRSADISKVGAVLPPDKKGKFVHLALMPMLKPFGFFFTTRHDRERLAAIRDLIVFSASQPLASNIFQAAVCDDAAQRMSFIILFEKLVVACLRLAQPADALSLLLAMQLALFPLPDRRPVQEPRAAMAVGHVFRHTEVLASAAAEVVPSGASAAEVAQAAGRAVDFVMLCCAGLEALSPADRERSLVRLISAPRLCQVLCDGAAPLSQESLRRLVASFPLAPSPESTAKLAPLLAERTDGGAARSAWFLSGLAMVLERHLLASGERGRSLTLWLSWMSWAKAQMSGSGAAEASAAAAPLQRFYSSSFVRALVLAIDKDDSEALTFVYHCYFSAVESAGESGEPPAEVLQTLAFSTPLAERLFRTLVDFFREGTAVEKVLASLGPPTFDTPEAARLRTFCAVYNLQMQPMYDYEFFGPANPLTIDEVQMLTKFLNRLAYHFVTTMPDKSSLHPAGRALRTSVTSLLSLLYNRHCRKPILTGENSWIIPDSKLLIRRAPVVDLGDEREAEVVEDEVDMEDGIGDHDVAMQDAEDDRMGAPAPSSSSSALPGGRNGHGRPPARAGAEKVLEAVLAEMPHVLPFSDRVELLHNVIQNDQAQRRETRGPWAQASMRVHQIRRDFLIEDGFAAFSGLADEGQLRDVFRVQFIDSNGEPESGVDGGGLFKELMIALNRAIFDPEFGLFCETSDRTLYPAIGAFRTHQSAGELFMFVGKLVGKAIYEMFLLEPQFSRVFLNRLLGRTNEVDDVAALDREVHRSMLHVKDAGNIEDLHLTFSAMITEGGMHEEVDLIPNGRNVHVTKDNLTKYFHLLASFKTNVQFQRHTAAFLQGIQCVIPLSWLKMFDPYELNNLISGSTQGFDVQDLRRNTNYSGGYQDDSPVVQWLWHVLEHEMLPEDLGRFLMFATSCSRAPLLGFKTLHPLFCIHRVPDGVRLPTSSTCANLLKLPDYANAEVLKVKLLQAIRAEAGFDLS